MSTWRESILFCERQEELWRAERQGLICAGWSPVCLSYYSKDPELQQRFALGYQRGRDQKTIEEALAKQKEAV